LAACSTSSTLEPPQVEVPLPLPEGIDFHPEVTPPPSDADECGRRESFAPDPDITAADARGSLIDAEHVTIGVSQSTNLMGYRDPGSGRLDGFDISVARELAERLMGDGAAVRFVPMTSGEREPALQNGDVDIVVRTMTMTCARWENVAFSSEYYTAGQRLLVTDGSGIDGLDDLTADHLVCTGAGSTSPSQIAALSDAQPVTVPDFNDCLMLIQQGIVDAVSTDDTILAGMAIQDPALVVVGEAFSDEPYGVAANSDNVDLVRFINGALEEMRDDGTWDRIYDRWLAGSLGDADAPKPQYRD
jgi:polar amino acid transport system substrate-binding protein